MTIRSSNSINTTAFILLVVTLTALLSDTVSALNCYTDVAMTVSEDCQMHTGCIKRFVRKTQRTTHRGCFLTPGLNDTCAVDPENSALGYCYCHTDFCNGASANMIGLGAIITAILVTRSLLN